MQTKEGESIQPANAILTKCQVVGSCARPVFREPRWDVQIPQTLSAELGHEPMILISQTASAEFAKSGRTAAFVPNCARNTRVQTVLSNQLQPNDQILAIMGALFPRCSDSTIRLPVSQYVAVIIELTAQAEARRAVSNTARKPLWQAAFSPSEQTKKYAKKCNGLE